MTIEKGFEINNGALIKYHGNDSNVVIPDGVNSIAFEAFRQCDFLVTVEIPESVLELDDFAI